MPWAERYDAAADALAAHLVAPWPSALPRHTRSWAGALPLATGIHRKLCALTDGSAGAKKAVREVLHAWCSSRTYRAALAAPGAMRHTLDGTPVGPVSTEHADHAREGLAGLGDAA